jgi:hypothetical protein
MSWQFNPQPQSRAEFQKNEKRIKDLVAKCGGDKQKEINKAFEMAIKITTPEKAYNRGHVAREMGYEHIFEVFYNRAYELGSVTTAEHRDHQIEKILSDEVDDYVIPVKKEKKPKLKLKKVENPKLDVIGYINPTDTVTLLIPKITWNDNYGKSITEYKETFKTDIDVNLWINTEEKCLAAYNAIIPILESQFTEDMEDEGVVIGVYKNGENSVLFASDLDYAWSNSLLYNTGVIPNEEVISDAHFNPDSFKEEHPDKYEKIKGLFHTKWK